MHQRTMQLPPYGIEGEHGKLYENHLTLTMFVEKQKGHTLLLGVATWWLPEITLSVSSPKSEAL